MSRGIRPIIREHIPLSLYEVLRKNKCIGKYIENTYYYCLYIVSIDYSEQSYKNKLKILRKLARIRSFNICFAFNWGSTPEGYEFWNNVRKQHTEYLYQTR